MVCLPAKLRHSCRGPLALALAWAVLTGCTTTTRLEPVTSPAFDLAVDDVAARPGAYARLAVATPPLQPLVDARGPYRIIEHQPGSVTLSDRVTAVRVPATHVESVSTYDHRRGALEGAVPAAAVGFVVGFVLRTFVVPRSCAVDDPCDQSRPIGEGVKIGALVGAVTGLIGGALGGAVGHETRYEITRAAGPDVVSR